MMIFGAFVSKHFCTETTLCLLILEKKFKIQKCWYQRDLGKLQLVSVLFLEWFLSIWTPLFSRETFFEFLNFFVDNLSACRFSQNVQHFPKKFVFSTFLTKTDSFDEFTLDINWSTFLQNRFLKIILSVYRQFIWVRKEHPLFIEVLINLWIISKLPVDRLTLNSTSNTQ